MFIHMPGKPCQGWNAAVKQHHLLVRWDVLVNRLFGGGIEDVDIVHVERDLSLFTHTQF